MTKSEFIVLAKQEVKGLTSYLVEDDYDNAADDASRETGWSFPVTGDSKIYWVKLRMKRHLFFYLYSESAHKFKYKQINLQHRFDHYEQLIKQIDTQFEKFVEERPDLFAGVDTFKLFGSKIDAGFAYDPVTGQDITYDENQSVIFSPKADD